MVFCSQCGKSCGAAAKFCEQCGAKLVVHGGGGGSVAKPVTKPGSGGSISRPAQSSTGGVKRGAGPKPTAVVTPASKDKPKGAVGHYKPTSAKGPSTADTSYDMGGGVKKTYEQQPAWAHAEQHKNQSGQFKNGMFSQTGPKYK